MLEAHIVAPRGSLYYAGGTMPYDLETLRQHVRDSIWGTTAADVALELIIDDDSVEPSIASWLREIAELGVQVRLYFAQPESAVHRGPRRMEPDDLGDEGVDLPPFVVNA